MGSLGASQLQRIDARIRKTKAKLSDEQLDVVAKAREGTSCFITGSAVPTGVRSTFEERELRRMLCPRYVRCMSRPVAEREQAGYDRQNGVRDQTNNETHRARASPSRSRRPSGRRSASAAASSSRPRRARPPPKSVAKRSTPSRASATPVKVPRISRDTSRRPTRQRSAGWPARRWSSTRSVCWMRRRLIN